MKMGKMIRYSTWLWFLSLFFLLATSANGQQTISGTITAESDGSPIPGVNVIVQGTTIGTTTNENGQYELSVPSLNQTLVISFVGFVTQEVPIGGRTDIDVSMVLDVLEVGEIVVGAYAPQRSRDVTGSISNIDFEREARMPLATQRVDEMLQGRAPGLQVNVADGSPGGRTIIRIRGMESITGGNEALIVIDGLQGADLRSINPRDIQSVEILKDASATALYGSEGASGVVLITTRQGASGKPIIDYTTEVGFQSVDFGGVKLLSPADWARNQNAIHLSRNLDFDPDPFFSEAEIAAFERGEGVTDWPDEIFRSAALHNHQLSVSGATENVNYRVSGSYYNQQGVLINSGYQRASLRANLRAEITDWASATVNWAGSREDDGSPLFGGGVDFPSNPINTAFDWSPVLPIYDEDGNYITQAPDFPASTGVAWNPVASAVEPEIRNVSARNNVNIGLDFRILEGLTLQLTGGAITTDSNRQRFENFNTFTGRINNGFADTNMNESRQFQTSNILTYRTNIDRHSITATAVAEQKYSESFNLRTQNMQFQNHATGFYNLGGSDVQNTFSGGSERNIKSALGRIAYEFDDRYLVTGSFRIDGSSVFGADNKWAQFPSFSLGWRISEEPFLGNLDLFENFLLRASWGRTGNQAISPYQSLASIAQTGNYPYDGHGIQRGFRITRAANPGLKWETTEQTNVGIDIEMFGGRLTVAADYYDKNTFDLLLSRNIPTHTGLSSILDNVGSVNNKGFEFMVDARGQRGAFAWSSGVTFTSNRNKVTDLGDDEVLYFSATGGGHQVNPGQAFMRLIVGEPFGQMFGWRVLGTWNTDQAAEAAVYGQLPGDLRYEDVNNDGVIDIEDEQLLGNTLPDWFFGWNNNVSYRNFELNFLIQGQVGHDIFNISKVKRLHDNQTARELLNRWTPDNQDTNIRAIIDQRTRAEADLQSRINFPTSASSMTSKFVEDGTYIRLRNIAIGYNLPPHIVQRFQLRNLRVHLTGTNLITLTNYTGFNPEVSAFTGQDTTFGTDFHVYPTSKTISLGFNVSF